MPSSELASAGAAPPGPAVPARTSDWRATLATGAIVLALAWSPSSYRGANRRAVATQLVATAPSLAWFIGLVALLAVVVAHMVVVTAAHYGMSRYAVELLLRLLAMELIPLVAVVFVALRIALPQAFELIAFGEAGGFARLRRQGVHPLQYAVLPGVLACTYAVWLLAVASWVVTGVVAYLTAHGFSPDGLDDFARTGWRAR